MILTIIESPYAGDIERNVRYARACMADSLSRGEAPIASHLLYTQPGILDDSIADERAMGILAGIAWARKADMHIWYTDLGWSDGMEAAWDWRLCNPHGPAILCRTLGGEWAAC